jgi:hypothetical protein
LVEQTQLISIIETAIREMGIDYPAIKPGVARESVPVAKAVLNASDKAGLEIVRKKNDTPKLRQPESSGWRDLWYFLWAQTLARSCVAAPLVQTLQSRSKGLGSFVHDRERNGEVV